MSRTSGAHPKLTTTTRRRTIRGSAVLCVDTGAVYESVRDAARAHEIGEDAISQCCRGVQKTAGGLHWEYADAESLCLSCQNAVGGCSWSVWDSSKYAPLFAPVKGWDATNGLREYSTHRNSAAYHVRACPQYIPDPERDLSRYAKIDKEIERENGI